MKLSILTVAAIILAATQTPIHVQAHTQSQSRQIDAMDVSVFEGADVVILGEVHDNPAHHAYQAAAVAAIKPKALVFEMFTNAQALRVRPDHLQDKETLEGVLGWADSGWPDFEMYYPIFTATDAPAIFGGAVERNLVRQAVLDGAATIFGASADMFNLNNNLDDAEQSLREAGQMASHCDALPEAMLGGMVEAQRLRDASMARAVVAAFAETGGPVVLITGNGHARTDWGVPRDLEFAMPELSLVSVAQFETMPEGDVPYDYWLKTAPQERDDPCEGFAIAK
jgi:uncharacterized iron-regulated protein